MQASLPLTVEQVICQIFTLRRISRMDQHLLMTVLLSKDSISPEEETLVIKVFDFL